jgi:hypothetical protein
LSRHPCIILHFLHLVSYRTPILIFCNDSIEILLGFISTSYCVGNYCTYISLSCFASHLGTGIIVGC